MTSAEPVAVTEATAFSDWTPLEDEQATQAWGTALGQAAGEGAVIYLHGNLGAGKTTLSRGVLRGLGHEGRVKSPTYTLVEPYDGLQPPVYHFDLYRLGDPEELEFMGIRDYFNQDSLCLVEWPERGRGLLPAPDLEVELRAVGGQREVRLAGCSERGNRIVAHMAQRWRKRMTS